LNQKRTEKIEWGKNKSKGKFPALLICMMGAQLQSGCIGGRSKGMKCPWASSNYFCFLFYNHFWLLFLKKTIIRIVFHDCLMLFFKKVYINLKTYKKLNE